MTRFLALLALGISAVATTAADSGVLFERTSTYHHIRVADEKRLRTLYFDDALETRMSLDNPLHGHFEYIDYFHMPWLWNTNLNSMLVIGLGGGSIQRSFQHYYPQVRIDSVEIDPLVAQVARQFFYLKETDLHRVHVEDGRVYLRRSTSKYDAVVLDAYVQGRYGSSIPQHLATREFFELARDRLNTNGVLAYNVIGTTAGYRANLVGAIYQTMKSVFPQVYYFPCESSQNIVLVATKANVRAELPALRLRAAELIKAGRLNLPNFQERLARFRNAAPQAAARSPVLSDDYAPVEGLTK